MLTPLTHRPAAVIHDPAPTRAAGSFWENFPTRFFYDLTDLPSLGSFAGAQPLYQAVRLGIFRGLGQTPGARLLAALGGLLAEAPAIVGLQRGLEKLTGTRPQAHGSFGEELVQTYRTMTAFRLFGSAAQFFLGRGNLSTGTASALTMGSMYGGVFLANIWNRSATGEGSPNYSELAQDSLVTLAQLYATGHMMRPLLSTAHFNLEAGPKAGALDFLPKLFRHPAYAGIAPSISLEPTKLLSESGNWFSKSRARRSSSGEREPNTIDSGLLGKFVMENVEGVPVFIPLVKSPKAKAKGLVLLISGLHTNHTRFGMIPQQIAIEGWKVRVLVYPGFENLRDNSYLKEFSPEGLAKHWQSSIRRATETIVERHGSNGEIYIGGYSMGGVGAVAHAYGSLPPNLQQRVSGLILAAPAFKSAYFETPSKFRNWFGRRVYVPFSSFLRREYIRASEYNSELAPHLESSYMRPATVDYAAILYCEKGKEVVQKFKGQSDLPRVLLIHTGEGDPVVSPKAAAFVKDVFGNKVQREILLPSEDGHYPLVGMHRSQAEDGILEFLAK